jgi:5,5'-dehydrodivanillate O-demethylase
VSPTHLKINFSEFEHGIQYQRVLEGQSEEDELWTIGRVCLWPNALYTGNHFEWRVPVDDGHTLSVGWFFDRVPNEMEPFEQDEVAWWYGPLEDPNTGRWIDTHVMNQDFIAWVGQGQIADRTQEHLGDSDRGVILMRRRMLEEAQRVREGKEPKGVIRDERQNVCLGLPIVGRKNYVEGFKLGQAIGPNGSIIPSFRTEFRYQQGQPPEITEAYREAMGLNRVDYPRTNGTTNVVGTVTQTTSGAAR